MNRTTFAFPLAAALFLFAGSASAITSGTPTAPVPPVCEAYPYSILCLQQTNIQAQLIGFDPTPHPTCEGSCVAGAPSFSCSTNPTSATTGQPVARATNAVGLTPSSYLWSGEGVSGKTTSSVSTSYTTTGTKLASVAVKAPGYKEVVTGHTIADPDAYAGLTCFGSTITKCTYGSLDVVFDLVPVEVSFSASCPAAIISSTTPPPSSPPPPPPPATPPSTNPPSGSTPPGSTPGSTNNGAGGNGGNQNNNNGAVTASLTANPGVVNKGGTSILTWSCMNATSAIGSGFETKGKTSGSISVAPETNTNYRVTCTAARGQAFQSASVEVRGPAVEISADKDRVRAGAEVTLTWSASAVRSCAVSGPTGTLTSGNAEEDGTFAKNSPRRVTVTTLSAYTIACATDGDPVSDTVIVNVLPAFEEF